MTKPKPRDHIRVYRWADAPPELRELCTCHGGDEDWLLAGPQALLERLIYEAASLTEREWVQGWGWSCSRRHELPGGNIVIVFAHA